MRSSILVAALPLTAMIMGCGSGSPAGVQASGSPAPAHPSTSSTTDATCVAGTWVPTPPDTNDTVNAKLPLQVETAHFAVHYANGVVGQADAVKAANYLELVFNQYINVIKFREPSCRDATKLKANLFIGAGYGLSGGIDGLGHMGMWIGPGSVGDHFGLAHEFTHALQGATGGLQNSPFSGWLWESHANFMATQMPEFRSIVHCSELSVDYPHLYYGSTRVRYCNFQFLEYLKDRFGYAAVNDIWSKSPKAGDVGQSTADPVEVLMRNQGWSQAQLNDVFGDWALHNVNWDYVDPDGTDHGAVMRSSYGGWEPQTGDRLLRSTILDPIDLSARRFAVPPSWAPQRWGYNVVKLHPDSGATSVGVSFRGVAQSAPATTSLPGLANEPSRIPVPASGWRWGVVAISADGTSRRSPLQNGSDATLSVNVRPDDQGLYLVVLAAPTEFQHVVWDQPYYSIYRFPWMVQLSNAMPAGYQPGAADPINGHRHANGGGWVANDATVKSSAYVGPYARVFGGSVMGNAKLEDHAVVSSGRVSGNAHISALSVIRGNTVVTDDARIATTFLGLGEYEKNIVMSGTAQNRGDVEQRGGSATKGVFYGFVDSNVVNRQDHGASLASEVPEVTAKPNFHWR